MKVCQLRKFLNQYNLSNAVKTTVGDFIIIVYFWEILSQTQSYFRRLLKMINNSFGSFEKMKQDFSKAAATRFGSGWAWMCFNNGNLIYVQHQIKITL